MVHDGNGSIDCPRQSHTKIGIGRELTLLHCWKLQHKPFLKKNYRQAGATSFVRIFSSTSRCTKTRIHLLRKKGDATVPLLVQSLELAQKTTEKSFIYLFFSFLHRGIN